MSAGYLTFVSDFVSKSVLLVQRAVFSQSTVQCSVRVQVQVVYCAACRIDMTVTAAAVVAWLALFVLEIETTR